MKPEKTPTKEQAGWTDDGSVLIGNPEKTPKETCVYNDTGPAIEAKGWVVCPTGYTFKSVYAKIYDEDPGKPEEKPPAGDNKVRKGRKTSETSWQFTRHGHPIYGANYGIPPACDSMNFLVVWALFTKPGNEIWKNDKVQFCGTLCTRSTPDSMQRGLIATATIQLISIGRPAAPQEVTDVIPVGDQYVIEAEGTASRANSSIQGVFAKIYRADIGDQRSLTPPADATAGEVFGTNGWEFKNGINGDFRVPGAVGSTGSGSDNNIFVVWAFFGGEPGDAANYARAETRFLGLLVDPPPGGGSVGDT